MKLSGKNEACQRFFDPPCLYAFHLANLKHSSVKKFDTKRNNFVE